MKKVIFALAAVVALAACSKEQTVSFDKGAAIGFDTFVDNATRVDPTLTPETMKTDGFGVYGFVTNGEGDDAVTAPLFTNEKIFWDATANNNAGAWTYGVKQYWIDGATYDFAAIAPYGKYAVTNATPDGVSLGFTNDGKTDLLYAQNNDVEGPDSDGKVGFTFKHLLSKVMFTFTNGYDATNTVIAVKGINITNAYSEGTAQLGRGASGVTAAWTPTADTNTLNLDFGDAVNAGDYIAQTESVSSANSLLLIPTDDKTTYNVTFTIELLYNVDGTYKKLTEYVHNNVSLTHNFEFGKSYNVATTIDYTNIVPDDPNTPEDDKQKTIEFTVDDIDEWVDGGNAGVVFPENN